MVELKSGDERRYYTALNEAWRKLNWIYSIAGQDKQRRKFVRGLINEIEYHCRKRGVPIAEMEASLVKEVEQGRKEYAATGGVPVNLPADHGFANSTQIGIGKEGF